MGENIEKRELKKGGEYYTWVNKIGKVGILWKKQYMCTHRYH